MEYLSDAEASALVDAARDAALNTYSPYSGFVVGAVVKTADGTLYPGTNVENVSYGLTICAERVAITSTVSRTRSPIVAVAVWTRRDTDSPCGACRQVILEFGSDIIVIFRQQGKIVQRTASELLPFAFTNLDLH